VLWLLSQLLVLLFFLIVIGEPLRAIFLRRLRLFADLDFLQVCLLDAYLGGLVLYVIAMLPLQLFNSAVVFGLTIFGFLFSIAIHLKRIYRGKIGEVRTLLTEHKIAILDYALVLAMFLVFLWIQIIPLTNFVFGSVHDTSLHSLMVQVILENQYVPLTLQPYLPEGIIYPQASHVIFAYASHILNYEAPKAVFYVTPLFNSLSVLGAYFLGKKLWPNRRFYLGLTFVFAFVSSWPLYITWGANPFITGFPLFLICLGLFFSLSQSSIKSDPKELVVVGILFGYSAAIIISYLETLVAIGFLWLIYRFVRKSNCLRDIVKKAFLIFFVSLLPLSPFLSRFIMFYQYPGHNIGVPSDFSGYEKQQLSFIQALHWASENLSPYIFLRVELVGFLIGLAILLWKDRSDETERKVLLFGAAVFLASTFLSFLSYFLPADFGVISWGHQSIILTIPIFMFIVVFYLKLTQFFNRFDFKWSSKVFSKRSHVVFLISIVSLMAINAPFMHYRLSTDSETLADMYGLFAVTTQDDYELMLWMRDNLPDEAVVLVNPNEAGLFIPSTSHHKVVFPFGGSQLSSSYQTLMNLLQKRVLNETTYELMQLHGISHVYVGARATHWWLGDFKWDYKPFLGNPNFGLIKNVNNAYLFGLSYYDPDIIFLDDFTYDSLTETGWNNWSQGDGFGNATITSVNGKTSLMLNSTKIIEENWFYAFWIYREIYFWTPSNVTLTFSLNASSGFNHIDDLAFIISNVSHNKSITISVNDDGFFWLCNPNPNITIRTRNFAGNFSYNLSLLWQQAYNSTLPNPFTLKIMNFDADAVTSTAYIDFVKITCQEG